MGVDAMMETSRRHRLKAWEGQHHPREGQDKRVAACTPPGGGERRPSDLERG